MLVTGKSTYLLETCKLVFIGEYFSGITISLQVASCPIKATFRSSAAVISMNMGLQCLSCNFDFLCMLHVCLSWLSLILTFQRVEQLPAATVCEYCGHPKLMPIHFETAFDSPVLSEFFLC